jgi:preprotein translocase subunit SecD
MNRGLMYRIWLVIALTVVAALHLLPTFVAEMPPWLGFLSDERVRLGLDLQGGTHLVLTVEVDKAVESSVERRVDDLRRELAKAGMTNVTVSRQNGLRIRVRIPEASRGKLSEVLKEQFPDLAAVETLGENGALAVVLELSGAENDSIRQSAVDQSLETIRNRIDQFGVTEPIIQRQGRTDILVQLPGIQDPQRAKQLIGKTALLEFKLVVDGLSPDEYVDGKRPLPPGTEILHGIQMDDLGGRRKGSAYVVESRTRMTGEVLTDARVQSGQVAGDYVVGFRLDGRGARIFEELTEKNVGRQLAIVLDNTVYSAPVIRTRIPGGEGIIEGNFQIEEARDLAIVLRAGALPAPVTIAEERSVGPTLGRDSIRQGLTSFAVGGALVVIFMVVYYKFAGLLADLALILNIVYLLAALALFHATLTLPGIAGIVLTLGMAVDANVLINERIREELRLGKTPRAAIEAGYERALPAILDSNITTFLSGVILFQFGSGPIKGFAVTLCIGIVSSVFTAVVGTRIVYDYLLVHRRLQKVSI